MRSGGACRVSIFNKVGGGGEEEEEEEEGDTLAFDRATCGELFNRKWVGRKYTQS